MNSSHKIKVMISAFIQSFRYFIGIFNNTLLLRKTYLKNPTDRQTDITIFGTWSYDVTPQVFIWCSLITLWWNKNTSFTLYLWQLLKCKTDKPQGVVLYKFMYKTAKKIFMQKGIRETKTHFYRSIAIVNTLQ